MTDITDQEVVDFCTKLADFKQTLSAAQKTLLDAILKSAWDIGAQGKSLDQEFDGCFEPEEAKLIVSYAAGSFDMVRGMVRGSAFWGMVK